MKKILFCCNLCIIASIGFASDIYLKLRITNSVIITARNGNDIIWVKLKDYSDTVPPVGTLVGIYGDPGNQYWFAEKNFKRTIVDEYISPDYLFGNTDGMVASINNKYHISGTILEITKDPPFK